MHARDQASAQDAVTGRLRLFGENTGSASYRSQKQASPSVPLREPSRASPEVWRVLSKCHDIRNLGEYEGDLNLDERIVTDLIAACRVVAAMVGALAPIAKP